jgi:L-ascorbate metabolism protein UlaG (beta-lactamase superfamily)
LIWAGTTSALAAGSAAWWGATSNRRSARWLRHIARDAGRVIDPAPVRPEPGRWSDRKITVSWLGHATVLINFFGLRILTDPALGSRVGVSLGLGTAGPKRYIAPALRFKDLPPIDVVLLSHAHMDHMDLPTLWRFGSSTAAVTARDTRDILASTRFKQLTELAWGEKTTFRTRKGEIEIEAFEVKHWGKRWPSEKPRGYNGYILRREGQAVLFGGDTADTPLFAGLRSRGPFELAVMPIGAYRPWIWNHCTPEQAFQMAAAAGAKFLVPIHHQTFRLSEEPFSEPIERLQEVLKHESERLALRRVGETFVC